MLYTESALCEFTKVELKIPRRKLLKLHHQKHYLDHEDDMFLRKLLDMTEQANYKILHVQSIIEKVLRKSARPQR